MRSTLSPMFVTLACIIAFTIAQPEIIKTSFDADRSDLISMLNGLIIRFAELGIFEPDSSEAEKLSKQINQTEENWAAKSLPDLITMQMEEQITRLLTNMSTEDLRVAREDNPGLDGGWHMVIAQVMPIVKKVEVAIEPNPDSTQEGIQKPKDDSQLLEELIMCLTRFQVSTKDITKLIGLVKGYTSSGKIKLLGLSDDQVISRRKLNGINVLDPTSLPKILLDAMTPLLAKAIASLGDPVKVIRNGGQVKEIREADLVRDDIIMVTEGQIVPADCRVIWSMGLKVNEFSLTGVSDHVEKSADGVSKMMPNGCRTYKNLIMKGTTVTGGEARAIVFGTGMNTRKGLKQKQQKEKSKPFPKMNKIRARASRNNKFAF